MAKNSIDVLVRANASKFNSEIKGAKSNLSRFDNSIKSANSGSSFKNLIGGALKLGAVIGGVALAAKGLKSIIGSITGAMTDLDNLGKKSVELGISTESLAGLRHAAEQTGSSATVLDKTLERLSKRSYLASEGTGAAKRALEDLGISAEELSKLPVEEQFTQIADAISQVENPSRRMALTSEILGDESRNLINLMSEGSAGIEEYRKEAEKLGLTKSAGDTKKIAAAMDAWDEFKKSLKGIAQTLAVVLAPALTWIGKKLTDFGVWVRETFEKLQPAIEAWARATAAMFKMIGRIISSVVKSILKIFEPLINWFKSLFPGAMSSFVDVVVAGYATVEFVFDNFAKYWKLNCDKTSLALIQLANDYKHAFVVVIPTIFSEFGRGTLDFFSNLASNISSSMTEIWDFIKSGGTDAVEIEWKPLSEGFKKALDNVKKSLEREESPTEKILRENIEAQEKELKNGLQKHVADRLAESHKDAEKEGKKAGNAYNNAFENQQTTTSTKALEPSAVEFGSQGAFDIIYNAMKAESDPQIIESKKQTKILSKIEQAIKTNNLELAEI